MSSKSILLYTPEEICAILGLDLSKEPEIAGSGAVSDYAFHYAYYFLRDSTKEIAAKNLETDGYIEAQIRIAVNRDNDLREAQINKRVKAATRQALINRLLEFRDILQEKEKTTLVSRIDDAVFLMSRPENNDKTPLLGSNEIENPFSAILSNTAGNLQAPSSYTTYPTKRNDFSQSSSAWNPGFGTPKKSGCLASVILMLLIIVTTVLYIFA